jgi:hypothetical protein
MIFAAILAVLVAVLGIARLVQFGRDCNQREDT